MLAVAVIVFREVLEAALIVSIVVAASVGIAGRNRWIGGSIAAGIAVAGPIAAKCAGGATRRRASSSAPFGLVTTTQS